MTVWFTADTHFLHRNLIAKGHREGFDTIEDHDQALIERWNDRVRRDDTVWHLGDFAMGPARDFLPIVARLHGTIHLITGNHDAPWPANRDSARHQRVWLDAGFASVQAFARRRAAGRDVLLSHFPYVGTMTPDEPPEPVEVTDEDWRPTRYEGYHVNAAGQVRGRFGRVLKPWYAGSSRQYQYVGISGVGNRTVHGLVCEAFRGPRPEGMQVAHWDGDPGNNSANNLRWATPLGNALDKFRHGTITHKGAAGEANAKAILTEELVAEIRASEGSYSELARLYGVSPSTIADIRRWRTWTGAPRQYPQAADHAPADRFVQYRLRDEGLPLIHGHVHGLWWARNRQLNVGVDVNDFQPVPLALVEDWVSEVTA